MNNNHLWNINDVDLNDIFSYLMKNDACSLSSSLNQKLFQKLREVNTCIWKFDLNKVTLELRFQTMIDLKRSQLQQIPQRNKDLAFGYVKNCEEINNNSIPDMIKYLCLIFLNQNKDTFDNINTHDHATINIHGNCVKKRARSTIWNFMDMANSYLDNIVSKGIHIWQFQCNKPHQFDQIGIRNIDKKELLRVQGQFNQISHDDSTIIGYAFLLGGHITPFNIRYGQECRKDGIVEMKLDFNDLSLNFKIRGVDFGKAFDIRQGRYRAVVGFLDDYNERNVKLISYQHIV